jgi:hypothetical protein
MSPEELEDSIAALGVTIRSVADALDLDDTNLWRQRTGRSEVSGPLAAAIRSWLVLNQITRVKSLEAAQKLARDALP